MKIFYLYLMIVVDSSNYYIEKIQFGFSLIPITCDEAFNKTVTIINNPKYADGNGENWVLILYNNKNVMGHYCIDEFGNDWDGYKEKLDYELR